MNYDLQIFNEIDDIDHFTIAVRKGKPFEREKAIWFLKRYSSYYAYVDTLDERFNKNGETFDGFTDGELYDCLVKMRDEMAKRTGIKGF